MILPESPHTSRVTYQAIPLPRPNHIPALTRDLSHDTSVPRKHYFSKILQRYTE